MVKIFSFSFFFLLLFFRDLDLKCEANLQKTNVRFCFNFLLLLV